MTKDPQCFVAPPQPYIGISGSSLGFLDKKASRSLNNGPADIYEDYVSRALAVQEHSAMIVEQAKAQETTTRQTIHDQLAEYTDYGAGWDGEDANAIEEACLLNMRTLIDNLPLDILKKVGSGNIFPTPNGTMTIEIGDGRQYFVVDVGNTSLLYYYRFNDSIAGLNEAEPFSKGVFQKITGLFSEFNDKARTWK